MKIFHVPKTGGTTLKSSLIDNYRAQREPLIETKIDNVYFCDHSAQISNDQYVLFIRDPIDRFISHFVFLRNRYSGYDTDGYFRASAPKFLKQFFDINDFVERVDKEGFIRAAKCNDLRYNLNYALKGLKGLKKYKDNLFFVGRMEYLEEDFYRLQEKLGTNYPLAKEYNNRMPEELKGLTVLKSKVKLRKLLDKEYKIIKQLCKMGFVDKSYLKEINLKEINLKI